MLEQIKPAAYPFSGTDAGTDGIAPLARHRNKYNPTPTICSQLFPTVPEQQVNHLFQVPHPLGWEQERIPEKTPPN
jgi:hypothetical protein